MKNKFFLFILLCFFNISLKLYAGCILGANNICTGTPVIATPKCIDASWPSGGLYNPDTTNNCIFHPLLSDDQPGCCKAPGCVFTAEFNGYECVCKEGLGVTSDDATDCIPCSVGTYGPKRTEQDSSNACVPCDAGQYSNIESGACSSCGVGSDWNKKYCPLNNNQTATTLKSCPDGATGSDSDASSQSDCYIDPCFSNIQSCKISNGYYTGKCYFNNDENNPELDPENSSGSCTLSCDDGYSQNNGTCDANIITIDYNSNGGEGFAPTSPTEFIYDTSVSAPENTYERDGYDFNKWKCTTSSNNNCSSNSENDIDPDSTVSATGSIKNAATSGFITLTAQWTPINYIITYHPNGGSCASLTPCVENVNYNYNIESPTLTLPEPTKEDAVFGGWYDNANCVGANPPETCSPITNIQSGSTGHKTFYAKWITCLPGQWWDDVINSCKSCSAGYYCPGGMLKKPCPSGHTNSGGIEATSKNTCYITTGAGENNTKFCDDDGARCFYLPNVGNIHWGPPQP